MQLTFCGLSVSSMKSSIGWGSNQTSSLTVTLVQDALNGDVPAPPPLGTPIYFSYGSFNFSGLLQKWSESVSRSGNPTFTAVCVDPREILEGARLIIGSYMGNVGNVYNVINVYGWWENNYGYGSSGANDSGMPWNKIAAAIGNICGTPAQGAYGGPLTFRGVSYGLDLSQLPVPDPNYRLGGTHIGLLEAISSICDDGGADFFVELKGFNIIIRTVSRVSQPPLGTIASYIAKDAAESGTVSQYEDGLEIRNDVTSSFIVGGEVCDLYQTDNSAAYSFWGYDLNGDPILGTPGVLKLFGNTTAIVGPPAPGKVVNFAGNNPNGPKIFLGSIPCEFMALNASPVANIIGSTTYNCSTVELRLAMVNYTSWANYIQNHRPDISPFIFSSFCNPGVLPFLNPQKPDIINDEINNAIRAGKLALASDFHAKAQELYGFVKSFGTDYYGKQFLVGLPFILQKQDSETLEISYSQNVTDGAWQEEGASPLGLSIDNEDIFTNQDGRFRTFITISGTVGLDLQRVSAADSVIENNTLYLKGNAQKDMTFLPNGQPAALVNLGCAVYYEATDIYGGIGPMMWATLALQPAQGQKILDAKFGDFAGRMWPAARYPDAYAIPLKSNVLSYGPWCVAGAPGKVNVEVDLSLTPWTYGGIDEMNAAANARVINSVTNMQVSEAGEIQQAGPPLCSLGDVLQTGGPNVSNISISYGKEGVETSYRFETFTQRFGVFSKNLADRIKKAGVAGVEFRRAMRANAREQDAANGAVLAAASFRGFVTNLPKAVDRQSPHEVLVCHSEPDYDALGNFVAWRTSPKTLTYEESISLASPDDPDGFSQTAIMTLDGLLRPFSTAEGGDTGMPGLTTPDSAGGALNSQLLNPFIAGNDITYLATGDTYNGLHTYRIGNDPANTRALALRGPVLISGWGLDITLNPSPGDGSGSFNSNFLLRSDQWNVGPLDCLWDDARGVWTGQASLVGVVYGDGVDAKGTGFMQVSETGEIVPLKNVFSSSVSGGTTIVGTFMARQNAYVIIAADCG